MHFNLLIIEGEAYHDLLHSFGPNHIGVLDDEMESHNYALKQGNLVYGYVVDDLVLGFLSFQPKENGSGVPTWTGEEKEALISLGKLLRFALLPDVLRQELKRKKTLDEKDPSLLKKSIDSFHQKGFSVWMDDFGSAYSSLNTLHGYHFDVIKFDLVFLRNFESSAKVILSFALSNGKEINQFSALFYMSTDRTPF